MPMTTASCSARRQCTASRAFSPVIQRLSPPAVAIRKRPIDPDRLERMISGIVRQLESRGETEIESSVVGELVMKALKSLDDVAYVRYASVYRDFKQTGDFADFLSKEGLADEPDNDPDK